MGLDQYAYIANKAKQREEFYETAAWDPVDCTFVNNKVTEPQEIAYWRKHPNLQGWMENLWESKGNIGTFNGIELELTWDDVNKLEQDIKDGTVAKMSTSGFFFGDPSDDYYKEQDLKFCIDAKAEIFLGRKVFYNSSW